MNLTKLSHLILGLLLALGFQGLVFASELQTALVVFQKTKTVKMSVNKTITSAWKPKKDLSTGNIYYCQGKIRWEITTPEKQWTIYNGKNWWSIEFASADFPGKNKVIKTQAQKKNHEQFFLLDLLAAKNPEDKFRITEVANKDHLIIYSLVPKNEKLAFSDIELTVNAAQKTITQISFKDDIGNITAVQLGSPTFLDPKTTQDLFDYTPDPDKDEVSQI